MGLIINIYLDADWILLYLRLIIIQPITITWLHKIKSEMHRPKYICRTVEQPQTMAHIIALTCFGKIKKN